MKKTFFLVLLALLCAALAEAADQMTTVDLTGNWRNTVKYEPKIATRDVSLKDGETKSFEQKLILPEGTYTLLFEYDPFWDKADGRALENNYEDFQGLKINGETRKLAFRKLAEGEFQKNDYRQEPYHASCVFEVTDGNSAVNLSLELVNHRTFRTWVLSPNPLQVDKNFHALKPDQGGELLIAHGVPFLTREMKWYNCGLGQGIDRCAIRPWRDGYTLDCGEVKVKTAHFLGMIHNMDIGNGSWYSPKGDNGYSHFIGDQAGEILVEYADGGSDEIPIIFGYNLWFARQWDMIWHYNWGWGRHGGIWDKELFAGNDADRGTVRNSMDLVDGVRVMGSPSSNTRFIFSVDLGNRAVKSMKVTGVDYLHDYPLISALTLETADIAQALEPLPAISAEASNITPTTMKYIKEKKYTQGVERLKRLLYNYVDDVPKLTTPEVPEGYFGPDYDFRGKQEALRAATYLYYNGPGNASFIADSGMICASQVFPGYLMHYTDGMGVWFMAPVMYGNLTNWFDNYRKKQPGSNPGLGGAWSRGIGENLRECIAFGYDKYITQYVDWLDGCLMKEANPPHWNRWVGCPTCTTYYEVQVGDIIEKGVRENDGHGICMWGKYMVYHWLGRDRQWNEDRWEATKAAVDWIQWQLDNDHIRPGVDKDVLYTESECAHGSYDIYSSYNCLHGLKLSIRMAEQLGKTETVESWKKLYGKLQQGILDNLVDEDPNFGPIWHTFPGCDWQDHAHKLCHIQLATEGDTYTPLQDYNNGVDAKYLEIDRNSYRFLMKEKNYNCLRMYGYGQGMMTQSALLLDEMEDAEHFVDNLVNHCFLGDFGRWGSPEGIILHPSGEYYLPVNGYMGQDAHIADSTKAIRVMLGVDDNKPDYLRLVPRYPVSWNYAAIKDFPVLTGTQRQKMSYTYERDDVGQTFSFSIDAPVEKMSVRLGPIPEGKTVSKATVDGEAVEFEKLSSGDSEWVWVHNLGGKLGVVRIVLD